jgi:transposase
MPDDPEASPLDSIVALARQIADECPSCASRASEIIMWASEIRERRPSREELAALVDVTCKGYVPDDQRELLIKGLRALVRFAE